MFAPLSLSHKVCMICVHGLLPMLSFQFRVKACAGTYKNDFNNTQKLHITEEMRAHSLIFTLRSCACMTLGLFHTYGSPWATQAFGSGWTSHISRLLIFLAAHMSADSCTVKFGTPGRTAIRGHVQNWKKEPPWVQYTRRALSFGQFVGIAHILVPFEDGEIYFEVQAHIVMAVAIAAFGMTLVRKRKIGAPLYTAIYAASIYWPLYLGIRGKREHSTTLAWAMVGLVARHHFGVPKYGLWIAVWAVASLEWQGFFRSWLNSICFRTTFGDLAFKEVLMTVICAPAITLMIFRDLRLYYRRHLAERAEKLPTTLLQPGGLLAIVGYVIFSQHGTEKAH
jgi:hypothetical protein